MVQKKVFNKKKKDEWIFNMKRKKAVKRKINEKKSLYLSLKSLRVMKNFTNLSSS